MSYKNSMKLLTSNFNFVWKQLVYLICCSLLLAVCSYTTIRPIINLLSENNIISEFQNLFVHTIHSSPNEFATLFCEVIKDAIGVIINNFSKISVSLIFAVILCICLPFILSQISIYNLSSIAYQKTTMNKNSKYCQNALTTFKPAIKYALANIILTLPFLLINILCVAIYILLAKTIVSALVGLIVLSAILMINYSIKISIFANYTGLVISNPQNMFKAFAKSFGVVLKNFWKNFSSSLIVYLTIVVVNAFVMVFTFFSGLLVSIPATYLFMAFYYIVSYLNSTGQRYYLSDTIIYNPVKHIVKKDDFVTITVPDTSNEEQVETTSLKRTYKKQNDKS